MNLLRLCEIGLLRLRSLLRSSRMERELDKELSFHLEQEIKENIAHGMFPDEARAAALRQLGGLAQIQEECRDMRRTNLLETIWKDVQYAVRFLARTPGFTFVIVLTIGLSIGANSAIFSVVEGVLLKPLPYAQPDRLVRVYFSSDSQPRFPLNPNDFLDFRARNRAFEGMTAIFRRDVQISGSGSPVMLHAFHVSAGYFRVLGIAPARGLEFTTADELTGHGRLAILSDRIWRTRFAADPGIIGRTIVLNEQPHTVVGIMPPGTRHPGNNFHAVAEGETVDLWRPYTFDDDPKDRGSHFMDVIGRLRPGITVAQGNADVASILQQLQREKTGKGWRVYLVPLYEEMVGRSQRMLLVLLGAVGLLLLIACVNAANLLLARSSARAREIAVRTALGAARGRIIRQLLTESMLIAFAGAALGTLLAVGGVRALVASLPEGFPRASEIRLDPAVFAFTLITAVVTGLLFGLIPALAASRTDLQQNLRDGGRSGGSGRQSRLKNILVVGETGLACLLLIAAGLMLHSFVNLLRSDPGFRPQQVMTASFSLASERYRPQPARVRFYQQLVAAVESFPGVHAAGVGGDLPWTGFDENADGFHVEGRTDEFNNKTTGRFHVAAPGYFQALGIPLLGGRFFTARDDNDAPTVLIVNRSMAERYWPGEDAVGKRITFRSRPAEKDWMRIVGVVGDVRDQPESNAVRPAFWFAHAQQAYGNMYLVVRSNSSAAALGTQLRLAVQKLDPGLAIADLRFMNQVADAAVSGPRFAMFLVGLFASLALVLAAIGIYGVVSYSVNQRMHEFGMRVALGASPWDLKRLIVGHGMRLSLAGAAIGLLCGVGLARVLGSLLYEVRGIDPVTFAGVAALAVLTAALACYVPARRACGADPMKTLRAD